MNKKILLITPVNNPGHKTPKGLRMPEIALSMIAAFTPKEFDLKIMEEEIEDIDLDTECDLVGISCMTPNAPRAYEIGKEFKKRGKTVVYGGIHPTNLPYEALQYGDSVLVGEAEGVWETLLEDYKKGELKPIYKNFQPDVSKYPLAKRNLSKKKGLFNIMPILTTRGCPYNCDFCSVPGIYGRKPRHLPISKVVEDIIVSGGKKFIFLDDNIIGYPAYAKKLFREIAPLNIKWVGMGSISAAKDEELMKLVKESGCQSLFFGIESVSPARLKGLRKNISEIAMLEDAVKRVQDYGILFYASIISGFDDDTEAVFDETLEFLMRTKVGAAALQILTPLPGTAIFKQYKEENRLITENWKYYDFHNVVYKPKNMTPLQLIENHYKMKMEFYKMSSITKRIISNLNHPLLTAAMNWGSRSETLKGNQEFHQQMDNIINDKVMLQNMDVTENVLLNAR